MVDLETSLEEKLRPTPKKSPVAMAETKHTLTHRRSRVHLGPSETDPVLVPDHWGDSPVPERLEMHPVRWPDHLVEGFHDHVGEKHDVVAEQAEDVHIVIEYLGSGTGSTRRAGA